MRIMGLDLSLTATGIAIADHKADPVVTLRTLSTHTSGVQRLCHYVDFTMIAAVHGFLDRADLIVIEDLPHGARNNAAGPLGMLHGAVRVALWREGFPLAFVPPASLKKFAVGKGNATKADMRMALYQRAGLDVRDDDQVDAWWLAAMACEQYGAPIVNVPAAQSGALVKVEWPDLDEVAA